MDKILCPLCKSPTIIVDHFSSWDNHVCVRYGWGCSYYAAVNKKIRERFKEQEPIILKIDD